jgi:copper(I)-binding protein
MRSVPAILLVAAAPALAGVTASDAWVRGTVPAQTVTGAFLTLRSSDAAKVIAVRSPVAASAEIHSTSMEGGVMHMRPMNDLALPAGKSVELKPGGQHIMLMGLRRPLAAGDKVPLVFMVEDAAGKRTTLEVAADVRPLGR